MAKKSLFISIQISVSIWKDLSSFVHKSQYIYYDCKLLAPVVYFADPVQTSLWAVWTEQDAQYRHSSIYIVNVGTQKNRGKQQPRKSRLLSSSKGEENRIEL